MLCMAEDGVVTPFLAQKDVKLRGLHNIENLLAAAAAVWGEVPVEAIQKVGSTFTGVEHRIEPVRMLDGVRIITIPSAPAPPAPLRACAALTRRSSSLRAATTSTSPMSRWHRRSWPRQGSGADGRHRPPH